MSKPKVCVLRAPGTNCDVETAYAFRACGAEADRVHLFRLLEDPGLLQQYQILCIAGGFSYGDDIGAGVIFSSQLRGQLNDAIGEFLSGDRLTLGICNGFQVLLKAGVLPDGGAAWSSTPQPPQATLTWNANGRYTALWVRLRVVSPHSAFLRGIDEIDLPIAHAEGRIAVTDPAVVEQWRETGQIGLCYIDNPETEAAKCRERTADSAVLPYPANPNGSIANIAGLSDSTGRILGLMPHPERYLHATQHPQWTRLGLSGEGAGMQIFRNAVSWFE